MIKQYFAYFLGGPLDLSKRAVGSLPADIIHMACQERTINFPVHDVKEIEPVYARLRAYRLTTEVRTLQGETYFVYVYEDD